MLSDLLNRTESREKLVKCGGVDEWYGWWLVVAGGCCCGHEFRGAPRQGRAALWRLGQNPYTSDCYPFDPPSFTHFTCTCRHEPQQRWQGNGLSNNSTRTTTEQSNSAPLVQGFAQPQ